MQLMNICFHWQKFHKRAVERMQIDENLRSEYLQKIEQAYDEEESEIIKFADFIQY